MSTEEVTETEEQWHLLNIENEEAGDEKISSSWNENEAKYEISGEATLDNPTRKNKDEHRAVESNEYKSRWSTSGANGHESGDDEDDILDFDDISFGDDLPAFADESCRALSREIQMLERKRDEAAANAKEHRERVSVMKDHLHNVRQEIVHTNGLLAAKNKEVATEKHLIALGERRRAALATEIKGIDASIESEKERHTKAKNRIYATKEELDKLKLTLNWNQEELEQWATAAAKKEGDTLALERFARADEARIKELTLKIENLTKQLVESQAELDNEKTETQSKQLEVTRITKVFQAEHDERRQLVQRWEKTVQSMKDRDNEIDQVSSKYLEAMETMNQELQKVHSKRDEIANVKAEVDELTKDLEIADRTVQNKRQERIQAQTGLQTMRDEFEVLKLESTAAASSLQKSRTKVDITSEEVAEKSKQLDKFKKRFESIKRNFESEKSDAVSKEKMSQHVEQRLKLKERELKNLEKSVQTLRERMFQDSQHLARLREKESNLISDIRCTQDTSKNLTVRLKNLEGERSKQQDLVYSADFKLQQMERKIARGLGERSDDEKKQLQRQIDELTIERDLYQQRESYLNQQCKSLQHEVQKWQRKKETLLNNEKRTDADIDEIELEIVSCETKLHKMTKQKEEDMVAHDLVRLEVRRLRDTLNKKAVEVYELQEVQEDLTKQMKNSKAELQVQTEARVAQLRAVEEERHRSAIELGQRKITAEKTKLKYEMLTKAHHTDEDRGEENSHVYCLIAAAQKRADLQREGDQLDSHIRNKERELKAMRKTLTHLKERNSDFRLSLSKIDHSSEDFKSIELLEAKLSSSDRALFEAKKKLHDTQRSYDKEQRKKQVLEGQNTQLKEENERLKNRKVSVENEIIQLTLQIDTLQNKIKQESFIHRKRDYPNIKFDPNEQSVQEMAFHADLREKHLSLLVKMLMELGQELPDTKYTIISSLTNEGIEVNPS